MGLTWVIEPDAFEHRDAALAAAARAAGHRVVLWDDMSPPRGLGGSQVVFHGSLNVATRVTEMGWKPGAWCNVAGFSFSAYAEQLRPWLLNASFEKSTVREQLSARGPRFVRPDSPLKPFAGRVVDSPTPMQLGLGFYHDDPDLPVIVSPVAELGAEWRFVVVDHRPVAWCSYDAQTRSTRSAEPAGALALVVEVSSAFDAPDPVYVLDVVETPVGPRLVEANPFSGADLYGCPGEPVVAAVAQLLG